MNLLVNTVHIFTAELVESAMYLYKATGDSHMLHIGASVIDSLDSIAKTDCGYAVVNDVSNHRLANRMESFFLAETTKYLYLLFDEHNFIHNSGGEGTVVNTPNGQCVIDAGGYIFNTEAHPVDMAALDCCHNPPREQYHRVINDIDLLSIIDITDKRERRFLSSSDENDLTDYTDVVEDEPRIFSDTKLQRKRKKEILLTCEVESFFSTFAIYGETSPK